MRVRLRPCRWSRASHPWPGPPSRRRTRAPVRREPAQASAPEREPASAPEREPASAQEREPASTRRMQERKQTRLSARQARKRAPAQERASVPGPGPPETETSDRPARKRARPEQTVRRAQERAQRATSVRRTREAARARDSVRPAQEAARAGDSVRPARARERALAPLRHAARRSSDGRSARSTPRRRQGPLRQSIPTANASRRASLIIPDFNVNLPSPVFVGCSYVKSVAVHRHRSLKVVLASGSNAAPKDARWRAPCGACRARRGRGGEEPLRRSAAARLRLHTPSPACGRGLGKSHHRGTVRRPLIRPRLRRTHLLPQAGEGTISVTLSEAYARLYAFGSSSARRNSMIGRTCAPSSSAAAQHLSFATGRFCPARKASHNASPPSPSGASCERSVPGAPNVQRRRQTPPGRASRSAGRALLIDI